MSEKLTIAASLWTLDLVAESANVAACEQLGFASPNVVPHVLSGRQLMKTTMIALLALAGSATAWAGTSGPPVTGIDVSLLPDAGSSLLLLGMGVTVVGVVRRAFGR